jgi:hypothetical protein
VDCQMNIITWQSVISLHIKSHVLGGLSITWPCGHQDFNVLCLLDRHKSAKVPSSLLL